MDAAGSERAALFGISEGGPMSVLFAATNPDRVPRWCSTAPWGAPRKRPTTPGRRPRRRFANPPSSSSSPTGGRMRRGWWSCSPRASRTIPRRWSTPPVGANRGEPGDGPADLRDVSGHRCAGHPAHDPGPHAGPPPARGPGGQSPRGRGARLHRSQAPDTWSFPGWTTCRGRGTLKPCSGRSRSS